MLTCLYPYLSIFVFIPILVWIWWPAQVRPSLAVRVPFWSRIRSAGGEQIATRPDQIGWLINTFVWLLIVAALVRPQWLEEPIERTIPTRDLLLVIDLSASMQHDDFSNSSGNVVDRLSAVKQVVGDFLTRRKGDRVGLVVFGNAPFLQIPLTTDLDLSRRLLDETAVGMAGPRTAFGDAIGLAIKLLDDSDSPQKTIIALTDGNDTASSVPPIEASRIARDRGVTVHTVAIGDPKTVGEDPLDEVALKNVAEVSGGKYYLALNTDQLNGIYQQLDEIETTETKTVSHRPRLELYYWPLGLALLLSLIDSGVRLLRFSVDTTTTSVPRRVRVNTHTFELETVEK